VAGQVRTGARANQGSAENALRKAARLPSPSRIAQVILDEIGTKRAGKQASRSPGELAALARAAREEIARGEVLDEDPSTHPD
jgi:hypothetical protein